MFRPGVIDENVDPSQPFCGVVHQPADLFGVGDVGGVMNQAVAAAESLRGAAELVGVAAGDRHAGAAGQEAARRRQADAAAAAGDEDAFAGEVAHGDVIGAASGERR